MPKSSGVFDWFRDAYQTLLYGEKPIIDDTFLQTGRKSPATTSNITRVINLILKEYAHAKIGKTGDPDIRTDQKDYRGSYEKMYLVYQTTSRKYLSHYETHYIRKFWDQLDNLTDVSGGACRSYDGFYYLYIVVTTQPHY